MNILLTFCYYIGKIDIKILVKTLNSLIKSLNYFDNKYILYVYTNIVDLENHICKNDNIIFVVNNISNIDKFYDSTWLNLSYYKIIIYKELLEKTGYSPIWIDLDTLVCRNINHLALYDNFFIKHGTTSTTPFRIISNIYIQMNEYIQGNIWKLDSVLLNKLIELWNTLTIKPDYDLQGLFNLAYHYIDDYKKYMLILGHDIDNNTINSLELYRDDKIIEPDIDIIKNTLIMINRTIIDTRKYKEVQFISFTFTRLSEWLYTNKFNEFTDKNICDFFSYCGLI